jgi:hypothetical protein
MAMPIAAAGPSQLAPPVPAAAELSAANMGSADNSSADVRNASLFFIFVILLNS